KLAMVTISWIGNPTHTGLGSVFLETAKNNRNIIAYFLAFLIMFPFLGLMGIWIIITSTILGFLMEKVGKIVFGGVSGDMIGATNEIGRAIILIFIAGVSIL
ncbi:hypothetical protein E2P47_01075, partial [Candidatus Bathyarchaeota archaeon]